MNRNVKYGIVGIALVGAIAIAFNGWNEQMNHDLESIKKEEAVVIQEKEEVAEMRLDIDCEAVSLAIAEGIVCKEEEIIEEEVDFGYIGGYTLTAYEWTGNPCANGNYPTCGYTAACNSLPLGTRIYIEGLGEYVIEDRGGMSDNVIDIYMGDVNTCLQFGVQYADVYIIY